MFEDDAILPDDYQDTPVEETQETVTEDVITEVEDTKPTEETKPEPETPKLKIKYNSEEREIPLDEAAALAQKGLNYEKAVERARQEARDAWVSEQGYTWNGKPLTTEAEYKQALAEQDLISKYKDKDLPEELINELVENRKFREQYETDQKAKAEKAKKDADDVAFLDYFKELNGRFFDFEKDAIPPEVMAANQKGVPLKIAYMEYQNKELRSQLKMVKQNEENKKKAPVGSVTAHGSTETAAEDDFIRGFNSE